MKGWLVGVVILGVLIGMGSLSSAEEKEGNLNLSISTDKKEYQMGESIQCTLLLGNVGNQPLVVNKRLVVNYDATFPHEVLFRITGPDGKLLEFIPIIKVGLPEPEDFTTLPPSEFIMSTYELSLYFSFTKEGKYSIQAIYENYYQPVGMKVWKGSITSNIVEIKLSK